MLNKEKMVPFLIGVIVGIFMTFIFLGGMFVIYKIGGKVFNYLSQARETREVKIVRSPGAIKEKGFKISFEDKNELEFFGSSDGLFIEQIKDYVTEGNYALLAEYPKGAQYPGLRWEVYRKDKCLDLSGGRYFSFDVHNNSEIDVSLTAKFKSGPNYPKKTFETHISLPAQRSKQVKIPIEELRGDLDVSEISYINFFISSPSENVTLYFDNIRMEK